LPVNLGVRLFRSRFNLPCLLAWFCSLKTSTGVSFAQAVHAGMVDQAKAAFSVIQASVHVLMFGTSLANGFATWRNAIAQSGCLPFGSLLANQRRQSAMRNGLVNCPTYGGQCACGRWQANAQ
jgi:hypothetical protein